MSQYRAGTVTVTSGSPNVLGSGTTWLASGVPAGSVFTVLGSAVPYILDHIVDDTHAVLTANYGGSTLAGQNYAFTTSFTPTLQFPYPEFGDLDTPTTLKRAMLLLENFLTEVSSAVALALTKRIRLGRVNLTYSASITPDASAGNEFNVTVTNNTAFTINAPTSPPASASPTQRMVVTVRNTSGGAMGAITWNVIFKMAAFTNPANGFSRSIEFIWDGSNWVERFRSAQDVPN